MPARLAESDQMTIEEFLAFTDARPDGERWELIEGVAIMNPLPTQWHQVIAGNILIGLGNEKARANARWLPMIGVGTRVPISPNSLPQPDVYVQEGSAQDVPLTDDALILFEVLSRSNSRADRAWRKRVYALPALRDSLDQGSRGHQIRPRRRLAGNHDDRPRRRADLARDRRDHSPANNLPLDTHRLNRWGQTRRV